MSNGTRQYRSPLFGGLLLILLGVIFLLNRFDPMLGLGYLIRRYWPLLIILWGVAKLIDYLQAPRSGQARPALLSGSEAVLLVLIALVLCAFVFRDWIRDHYSNLDIELPPFSQRYSQSVAVAPQTVAAGARVEIATGRGNITVRGGNGDQLIVSGTKSAPGANEESAQERMRSADITVESRGAGVFIHPRNLESGVSIDLDIQLPKAANLSVDATHGDVHISGVQGNIEARSENGDLEIHDAGGSVTASLQQGDARITGIGGDLKLIGRGADLEIEDVSGNATIDGAFVGSTTVRNVAKITRYTSPWSDVSIARMTGRMQLDSSDIEVSDASGDAKIVTRNKDIDMENIGGRLEIYDSRGDIKVGYVSPPRADVSVTDDSGEVELTLPAKSSFAISAVSRSGDVECDFEGPSLKQASSDGEAGRLSGTFSGPGPQFTISTSYGTIRIHKSH